MSTPNAATAARRRHDEFVAFLDRIGYEPQGRYAKAGKLRREDVETLMQGGALDHIWSWVQHNIKSTEDINMLRRNLHVSHQAMTSPDAMELKKRRIAALTEKRRLLHDAVSKLQAENKQAIANLVSVEQAMTSICDPPIQALLEDTYVLQTQYRHQERAIAVQDLHTVLTPPLASPPSQSHQSAVVQDALRRLKDLLKQSRPHQPSSSPRHLLPRTASTDKTVQAVLQLPGKVVLDELEASTTSATTNPTLAPLTPYRNRHTLHDIESQVQHHVHHLYEQLARRQQECDHLLLHNTPSPCGVSPCAATTSATKLEWLQSYGDELVLELKSLDAAAAAAADHMSAMASFETRLDHAHTSVASAFRTNRALVVDILDRQSKLLLFLQSEVVDAFKVGSY
ncbi:hypothetical protein, variant 3 [Aphanomyces astaci]|uniref:Uncharacterized protein n=1 Tax=Aphanomyces astaci TaxID=112090 RepID=W4FT52_APHAT|nr:hypothetical protein, variant 1 [Aphanomyces astaci]XP_009839747.1 hypothetical protein, variant 2 [Aphanomyces astaci]XP_009839749.1 hypothetical protein, variant 3 [Aphanomyces astaci]ETV70683.1 hypothetical protein, variant 1 [Aphanomyces astaci]ETV70684.1 hypothetical protein, variant 2 [Aphanomyces astaci]ETV70685.1 hypothetical protein, variant 3 [Aphanomyces astaci]|eukprot:XP_009839746.1 hypothetical protein, variant 1 [Aphanomyces astaci]